MEASDQHLLSLYEALSNLKFHTSKISRYKYQFLTAREKLAPIRDEFHTYS